MPQPNPYPCPVCKIPMKALEPLIAEVPDGLIRTNYLCDKCNEHFVRTTPNV